MMDIRPIRSEADYDWALSEIAPFFEREPEAGTADADRFDVLAVLIEEYEARHWAIKPLDPISLLQEMIDDGRRSQGELADVLGSTSRASEVLKRKRALNLDMIRRVSEAWHVPVAALTLPYDLARAEHEGRPAKPRLKVKLGRSGLAASVLHKRMMSDAGGARKLAAKRGAASKRKV